jgi:hypothetical protein
MQDSVLSPVLMDQSFQYPFPLHGQLDEDLPSVFRSRAPFNQTEFFGPVDQFHYAVMVALKLFGKLSDRSEITIGKSFDSQNEMVLLRSNPLVANRTFTVTQETTQTVPEGGNSLEVSLRQNHLKTSTHDAASNRIKLAILYRGTI